MLATQWIGLHAETISCLSKKSLETLRVSEVVMQMDDEKSVNTF